MTTYAGEVRIKTKLDTKDINDGMKAVSAQLGNITKAMAVGTAGAVAGIVAIVGAVGVAFVKAFKEMSKMDGFKDKLNEVNLAFANLKNAAYSAVLSLFNALLPVIMRIVDWLTRAANTAAAFFAALSGASTYMVYVASSLGGAADSSGQVADNLERAEEAAGKLAGFDKLNILGKDKEPKIPKTGGGSGGSGGAGSWVEMPIDEDIQEKARKVREFFEKIKGWAIDLWEGIKSIWGTTSGWFKENVIDPLVEFFKNLWENPKETTKEALDAILGFFIKLVTVDIPNIGMNIWNWLKETLPVLGMWFGEAFQKISVIFQEWWRVLSGVLSGVWEWVKEKAIEAWEKIKEKWQPAKDWFNDTVLIPIKNYFTEKWEAIKLKVTGIWDSVKEKWQEATDWFKNTIIDPIVEAWDTATGAIKNFFTDMWDGIKQTTKTVINSIISFINKLISGVVSGVNAVIRALNKLHFEIPDWVPFLGGKSFGFNISEVIAPQIPMLATGAVIPPNAPFAAILGDQKHGRNIEAPEDLLRQIVRDEMRGMNNQPQTIHNVLKLDGRIVYESWDKENRRVGGSMLTKGASI